MPTVLVTGINAFVGVHTALYFLERGWNVKGTVRSQKKGDAVLALPALKEHKDKIETVVVEDLITGDFSQGLDGADAVAHVASPWSFSLESWEDYRDPAVKGTTNVLEQALKYPQIKAVSVISSFAAIGDTCEPWYNFKGKVYTEADWNPYTAEQCEHITPELEGRKTLIWYCVSKKEAEKAAEAVGKRSETHYALSMMCPPAIYGPPIHIADGSNGALKDADVSTETLYEVLASGKDTKFRDIAFPAYAEVRTVAACTFNAIDKQISGRFLICDGYHDFVLMNRVAHKVRPDLSEKGVIPKGKPEGKTDIEDGSYRLDACKAKKELGLQPICLEQMVSDIYKQYEAIGAV